MTWEQRFGGLIELDGDEWDAAHKRLEQEWLAAYTTAFVKIAVSRGWRREDAETWPVGIGDEALIVAPPPSPAARRIVPLIGVSLICRLCVSDEFREHPISAGYVAPAACQGDSVRRLSEIIRLDCAQLVVQSIRHPVISICDECLKQNTPQPKMFFYSTERAGVGCPAAPAGRPEADEHHFLRVLRVKR
jgi:hypothetical protein